MAVMAAEILPYGPPPAVAVADGPDVPVLNYDLTTLAGVAASGLVPTRTGAAIWAQQGASTVVSVGNDAHIFEDYGADDVDPLSGGGLLAGLDAYTPTFVSFDFSPAGGWTHDATVVYTPNAQLAPNGAMEADRVEDNSGGARAAIYRAATLLGHGLVWEGISAVNPATADGAFALDNTPNALIPLSAGSAMRKRVIEGAVWSNYSLFPSYGGGLTATGGRVFWGAQYVSTASSTRMANISGLPLLASAATSGNGKEAFSPTDRAQLLGADGIVDVWLRFRPLADEAGYVAATQTLPCYLFAFTDQLARVSSIRWVRSAGVDRQLLVDYCGTTVITSIVPPNPTDYHIFGGWRAHDEITGRVRFENGRCAIRFEINGLVFVDKEVYFNSVAPITSIAAAFLGSHTTNTGNASNMRWTGFRCFHTHADWDFNTDVDGLIMGDSTAAQSTVAGSIGTRVLTVSEARAGYRIGMIAKGGDTNAQQQTKWLSNRWRNLSRVKWLCYMVSRNGVAAGQTAVAETAIVQAVIDDALARIPGIRILILGPQPSDASSDMTAGEQVQWRELVTNLAGTGPNPITGATTVDLTVMEAMISGGALAAAGSNTLANEYNRANAFATGMALAGQTGEPGGGDELHDWWNGRQLKGNRIRTFIIAQGVGP